MNVKSLLHRLPLMGGASSVLVCETDGFSLCGAVFVRDGEGVKPEYVAQSEALEYRQAVDEVVAEVRRRGWQGKRAVLLTPAVFSALVELPVSPRKPRTGPQMQELVRWELEPLLMQHAVGLAIGQVMLRRGYLDAGQITEIMDRQQGKLPKGSLGDGHGAVYSFKRFGELAVEMGHASREQVDECLMRQSWLKAESEDTTCGWTPQQPRQADDAAGDEDDGIYPWLASGANAGMLRQWGQAFAACKVQLDDVYPLVGAAAELLEQDDGALLLAPLPQGVTGMRIVQGALATLRQQPRAPAATALETCLESYHDLIGPEIRAVWLTTREDGARGLVDELAALTGREVQLLAAPDAQVSADMAGAALLVLVNEPPRFVAPVSVRGPQPPLWQRVEARAVAAAVLLLLVLVTLEITLQVRQHMARAEFNRADVAKKQFDDVVKAAQAKVDAVNKLKAEIAEKQTELNDKTARFDFFAIELPERSKLVQTLLADLSSTVTEDVVIDVLEETPNLGYRVAGWALSETAAQQFIQTFQSTVAALELDVADPLVRAQTGRLGLPGYGFYFRLVSTRPEEAAPAATAAAKPAAAQSRKKAKK